MGKSKYILSAGASGQVWAAKPLYKRVDGGKFDLDKPESLTQQDLEYLHSNDFCPYVLKVEVTDSAPAKVKKNK